MSKVKKYVSKNWHSHNFIGYVETTFFVSNLGHLSIAYTLFLKIKLGLVLAAFLVRKSKNIYVRIGVHTLLLGMY